MKASIVIPCFNESGNLIKLFKVCDKLRKNEGIEFVFVNNGSTDNSHIIFNQLRRTYPDISVINIKNNEGYGGGIIRGLEKCTGDILGWTHADLQSDPNDLAFAIKFFNKKNKNILVKGVRKKRALTRSTISFLMTLFELFYMRKYMYEITAQPTLFHRSFYDKWIKPPKDFGLDLFVFYSAKMQGIKIIRFPVIYYLRHSGSSAWNDSFFSNIKQTLRTFSMSANIKKNFHSKDLLG
jgi:polyisoprenyl-phosphate glycosyltransferase